MQVDVQIGCRAKEMDQCDRADVGVRKFAARLLDQKGGNDAVDDLQHG